MRRVKDWLIKKLGGYTQTDHDKWFSYKDGEVKFWRKRAENLQERVVTLNVEETVGKEELLTWTRNHERELALESLTLKLARRLMEVVRYERMEMPMLEQIRYEVRLMVLRPADRTEEE